MKKVLLTMIMAFTVCAGQTWGNGCTNSAGYGYCDSANGGTWGQSLSITSGVNISIYSVIANDGLTTVSTGGGGYFYQYLYNPGVEDKSGYIDYYQNDGNLSMSAYSGEGSATLYVNW